MNVDVRSPSEIVSSLENEVVANVVNLLRNVNQGSQSDLVLKVTNSIGQLLRLLKNKVQSMVETDGPYLAFANEIHPICNGMLQCFEKLKLNPQDHSLNYSKAEESIKQFQNWLFCSPAVYTSTLERPVNEVEMPSSVEMLRADLRQCPRWILRQLWEARQAKEGAARRLPGNGSDVEIPLSEVSHFSTDSLLKGKQQILNTALLQEKEELISKLRSKLCEQVEKSKVQQENILSLQEQLDRGQPSKLASAGSSPDFQPAAKVEAGVIRDKDRIIKDLNIVIGKYKMKKTQLKKMMKREHEYNEYLNEQLLNLQQQMQKSVVAYYQNQSPDEKMIQETCLTTTCIEVQDVDKLVDNMLDYHDKDNADKRAENLQSSIDFRLATSWMNEKDRRLCLTHFLLDPTRDYVGVRMLGKLCTTMYEKEGIANTILDLYHSQGRSLELVLAMIDYEITNITRDSLKLFTGEDLSCCIIRAYPRLIGKEYLFNLFGPHIAHLIDKRVHIEINLAKLNATGNSTQLADNINQLLKYSQLILDVIYESLHTLPISFFQISNYLANKVSIFYKDPNSVQNALIGFILNRFYCDCLTQPENYNFSEPPTEVRRTLILIAKILISLANGFSSFKEPYLSSFVPFMDKNRLKMEKMLDYISSWPPQISESVTTGQFETIIRKNKHKFLNLLEEGKLKTVKFNKNIEISPLSRIKTVFSRLPTIDANNSKKVDIKKFPQERNSLLSQSLIMMYLDSDGIPGAITKCLMKMKSQQSLVREKCKYLGELFLANEALEFLFRNIITTELSEPTSAFDFLHNSVTKFIFDWYTKCVLSPLLTESWKGFVEDIVSNSIRFEIEESPLNGDSVSEHQNNLRKLCYLFVQYFLQSLPKYPKAFWEFATLLVDYTSQSPFQFILVNFLSVALEKPMEFGLSSAQPGRSAQTTLSQLSTMISNIGYNASFLLPKMVADKQTHQKFHNIFEEWLNSDPEDFMYENSSYIAWEAERNSLIAMTDFVLSNLPFFENQLKNTCKMEQKICYNLKDLIQSID